MGAMAFGFSAQSDESRHMTLGLEIIKFILSRIPTTCPSCRRWIDKWFWRGYRAHLVAMMMDYMLPKRDELERGLGDLCRAKRRRACSTTWRATASRC